MPAYARVKKAWSSFLQCMPGLSVNVLETDEARKLQDILEKITVYIAKEEWLAGFFKGTSHHGVPVEADIRKLQDTLRTRLGN